MGIAKKYRLVTENNFGQDDISFTPNQELRKNLQDIEADYPTRDKDFLLRSGTFQRQAKDVERLGKFFTSPEGLLFTTKQNLLSRTGVKTEASGLVNEGPYLPDSTISQVGSAGIGFHQTKNGLDDSIVGGIASLLGLATPGRLPQYVEAIANQQTNEDNRLVQLLGGKIHSSEDQGSTRVERAIDALNNRDGTNLLGRIRNAANIILKQGSLVSPISGEILRYGGGPGSEAGVGETVIRRANDTTLEGQISRNPEIATQLGIESPNLPEGNTVNEVLDSNALDVIQGVTGVNVNPGKIRDGIRTGNRLFERGRQLADGFRGSIGGNFNPDNIEESANPEAEGDNSGNYYTLNPDQIDEKGEESQQTRHQIKEDFRRPLLDQQETGDKKKILSNSLPYTGVEQMDIRVNHGTPGDNRKDATNYQDVGGIEGALDKVNALPLYEGPHVIQDSVKNDLVKFRIAAIDTNDPSKAVFIHFRAFLKGFSDSYNAAWDSQRFMGRGENFYKYNGFDRQISMGWTVVAQSKNELMEMYKKLNFLASNLAPDYTTSGYMGGPLVRLTVGGYLYEQPGLITSLNYEIPDDTPWEIAIPSGAGEAGMAGGISNDPNVKEMPHRIEVSGFNFIPIHDFTPRKQQNRYGEDGQVANSRTAYGLERYIALANGPQGSSDFSSYDRRDQVQSVTTGLDNTALRDLSARQSALNEQNLQTSTTADFNQFKKDYRNRISLGTRG